MKLLGVCVLFLFLVKRSAGVTKLHVCAIEHTNDCTLLARSDSEVNCVKVQDNIECAQRLANGTADFGVFTAEDLLQLSLLNVQDNLVTLIELRHKDRSSSPSDFQSVAVVRRELQNGFQGLKGRNFCHPGLNYEAGSRWSERFLKHFERTVAPLECSGTSPAETEAITLSRFFSKMCRPGTWSHNKKESDALKNKYPTLCELCGGKCSYTNDPFSNEAQSHQHALDCLTNRGFVAYVSLEDAKRYFDKENETVQYYRYLCPDETMQNVTNNTSPCTWLQQPWPVVLGDNIQGTNNRMILRKWLEAYDTREWKNALRRIILGSDFVVSPQQDTLHTQKPREHVRNYREVPIDTSVCPRSIRWCTTSPEEHDKCEVVKAGGQSLGVFPSIECNDPTTSTFACLQQVNSDEADFVSIDSSYGYVARNMYNLTSALYFETDNDKYATVVAVVKSNSKFKDLKSLRGSKACMPLFAGTSAMAFINFGKSDGFFSKKECHYGKLLHDFFGESCIPGARDARVSRSASDNPDSLCALCKSNISPATSNAITSDPPVNCRPDKTNRYFGDKGALKCLHDSGDVAILELQHLKEHAKSLNLSENDFQIICRNGQLSPQTGFDVSDECPLATIVDGEVAVKANSNRTSSIVNVLTALEKYFRTDPNFKMFNIFQNETDLLFKDSTIGLTAASEESFGQAVKNYFELFSDIETCVQKRSAGMLLTGNIFLTLFGAIAFNIIINNYFQ